MQLNAESVCMHVRYNNEKVIIIIIIHNYLLQSGCLV